MTTIHVIDVVLKWSKEVIEFEFEVPSTSTVTGKSFKETVHSLTSVPVDRQKIVVAKSKSKRTMGKKNKTSGAMKWWKAILKDDFDFASAIAARTTAISDANAETRIELRATLMGTAEVLESNSNKQKTVFIEGTSPSEQKEAEQREWRKSMANVTAMIPALQVPPIERQPPQKNTDDGDGVFEEGSVPTPTPMPMIVSAFEETRAYGRLVHGYSQLRIDALLREQQQEQQRQTEPPTAMTGSAPLSTPQLLGRSVMTMGLELQRAYVNDLAVLNDGTLVSGLDNGHVQLWKHCRRACDIVHQPDGFAMSEAFSGVDSVLALDGSTSSSSAFCTAGRGCLRVWDSDGEALMGAIRSPLPLTSPTGLVRIPTPNHDTLVCVAARLRVALPGSHRPRLVPWDEASRLRLTEFDVMEAEMNETVRTLSKMVQIFVADIGSGKRNGGTARRLQTVVSTASAPVTALESWKQGDDTILAIGDSQGGILLQKVTTAEPSSGEMTGNSSDGSNCSVRVQDIKRIQFVSMRDPSKSRSAIVCMKFATDTKQLWVSTKEIPSTQAHAASTFIPSPKSEAVHSIDMDVILNESSQTMSRSDDPLLFSLAGHKDVVQCIVPLPNGDLVTAGGKHDATTQMWSRVQLETATVTATVKARNQGARYEGDPGNTKDSNSNSPQILTKAATANLCKDAGYVFAVEVLRDFKSKDNPKDGTSGSEHQVQGPFAIAIARYNVVKIIV
mmetsp:Transcript_21100/g.58697  ORF Transcript_21100/g.58697 Transcript_21100/m.58697 type:complete len:730 (+) Transcript_21100:132-2321(+)